MVSSPITCNSRFFKEVSHFILRNWNAYYVVFRYIELRIFSKSDSRLAVFTTCSVIILHEANFLQPKFKWCCGRSAYPKSDVLIEYIRCGPSLYVDDTFMEP